MAVDAKGAFAFGPQQRPKTGAVAARKRDRSISDPAIDCAAKVAQNGGVVARPKSRPARDEPVAGVDVVTASKIDIAKIVPVLGQCGGVGQNEISIDFARVVQKIQGCAAIKCGGANAFDQARIVQAEFGTAGIDDRRVYIRGCAWWCAADDTSVDHLANIVSEGRAIEDDRILRCRAERADAAVIDGAGLAALKINIGLLC